jgi:hypothetical protein
MNAQSEKLFAGALTPLSWVARAVGLEVWAVEKLMPEDFRSAENFQTVKDVPCLTVAGLRVLSAAVERRGYAVMANELRVLANERAERSAIWEAGPVPMKEYWWRKEDAS